MYYSRCFFCTLLLLTSLFNFSQTSTTTNKSVTLLSGYNRGFGLSGQFTFHNFLPGNKDHIRVAVGYTFLDPGNSNDAQRIFVSDITTGLTSQRGRSLDFRIDYLLAKRFFNFKDSYMVFGPRYLTFKGTFNDANNTFDVTFRQLGAGIGAENYFYLDRKFDFVITAGLDYFFPGTLYGPQTFYRPNNDNINARIDLNTNQPFTYKDANKAIKQPQLMPRILIGIAYYL